MNTAAIRRITLALCVAAVATVTAMNGLTLPQPTQASAPQSANSQATPRIQLSFDRVGYEWWGRPFFMDDTSRTDCYTNVGRRMMMLSVGVRIRNNSRVTMTPDSWNMVWTNNKGRRVSWCFVLDPEQPLAGDTAREILSIGPGETVAFAAQVFIEPNERVRSGYVVHKQLGRSNTAPVPASIKTAQ